MDKEILKQIFKPICIHEFTDEYFDALIVVIETSCNEKSFDWFIKCIKGFALGVFDDEFKLSLVNYLHFDDEDISFEMISKNKAELLVFTQAIVYECIINNEDKVRASTLSLALNTIMFGIENSLNQFYITKMKTFYRANSKKTIQEVRESENNEENIGVYDFIKTENKVLKWMLNLDRRKNPELSDEQFVFYIGKELAEISSTNVIFNYPEAYIAKILHSSSVVKNYYSKKIDIQKIFSKLNSNVGYLICDSTLFPIMNQTLQNNMKISLIDFVIEVYYEQMLLNNIIINNYAK